MMNNRNLVGRCGLYCGACIIYRAYKDSEELREKISKDNDCDPEDVKCEGCQSNNDKWNKDEMWGESCDIVKCLDSKGLTYCYECDNHPDCQKYDEWADIFSKDGEDIRNNLEMIEEGKIDDWLKKEEERWVCKECGKPISMVLDRCHWCGAAI